MLYTARCLRELSFEQLMAVYREGNEENGRILAPFDSQAQQIRLAEEDFYSYLQDVFFRVPGAMYAVWTVQGRYVSALRLEPYRDGLLLEALETAPQERGRGYAVALIRAVQEWLGAQGQVKLYSHVSKSNTPSMKTHLRCGFHIVSDTAVYLDGSADSRAYTMQYKGTSE